MATKLFFLLALIAIVYAESDCECEEVREQEITDVLQFLKKYSEYQPPEIHDPEDTEMGAVNPAVLSPLLDCPCMEEKNRSKRKTVTEVDEATEKVVAVKDDNVRMKKSIHYDTRRCPRGFAWIGFRCVHEELLELLKYYVTKSDNKFHKQ